MGKRPRCDTVAGRVRNAIVAFVAAAALWVARPATAADAPPLLTLPPGANATLVLSDKPDQPNGGGAAFTARVPVTVAADKDIDVRLTDVAYKDARSADWFQRFAVDLDRTTAPAAYALIVSHRDAKLWPGTYALTLRVSEKPKKATDDRGRTQCAGAGAAAFGLDQARARFHDCLAVGGFGCARQERR